MGGCAGCEVGSPLADRLGDRLVLGGGDVEQAGGVLALQVGAPASLTQQPAGRRFMGPLQVALPVVDGELAGRHRASQEAEHPAGTNGLGLRGVTDQTDGPDLGAAADLEQRQLGPGVDGPRLVAEEDRARPELDRPPVLVAELARLLAGDEVGDVPGLRARLGPEHLGGDLGE